MEAFPAIDMAQFENIKKVIDECDYYLLIIGARYGSIDADGVSFTEREFDYAVSKGKTVITILHDDVQSLPSKNLTTILLWSLKSIPFVIKLRTAEWSGFGGIGISWFPQLCRRSSKRLLLILPVAGFVAMK